MVEKKISELIGFRGVREEEVINVQELVGLLLDKIWFILAMTLIALIGSAVFFYSQPNQYLARCRLLIESPLQETYLNAQEYKNLMILPQRSQEFYNTQLALIKSTPALVQLINATGFKNVEGEKIFPVK